MSLAALAAQSSMPAASASQPIDTNARAIALLSATPCSARTEFVAQATPIPSPSPTATGSPFPFLPTAPGGSGQLYATPFPRGTLVTPPPIPTPAPSAKASSGPIFLTRPSARPSIVPMGSPTASPSPTPSAVPTLAPGYVAVVADKLSGNAIKPGAPGDATGNVHIYYQDEVLVGDRAHYDGIKTISVTGNPYIVNNAQSTIYHADEVRFDTIAQTAELINGHGESSQGVERGLVYFGAKDLRSDEHGVAHGDFANVTTCERPRAGYHITGRTIDVYPSDRLVISKAVLWLGAAAIFYLPRIVIPLRRIEDERQRPSFFPEIGYNSDQGVYIKAKPSFGRDQYFYGYYRVEYYSREGFGFGYTAYITQRNGRRQSLIDAYAIHDRRRPVTNFNANVQDSENFSQRLRGIFGFTYTSNYGPLSNIPPNETISAQVAHTGPQAAQTYSFQHNGIATQASTDNFGFAETRTFGPLATNSFSLAFNRSRTSYFGNVSRNSSATLNDLLHWGSPFADYSLTYKKSFQKTPFDLNYEPEFVVRPRRILPRFFLPIGLPSLTIGEYNEPQTPLSTSRADLYLPLGPVLYHFLSSDLSAGVDIHQFAYGTGDLKASITQRATLSTAVGNHLVNSITYNETNYNGPPQLPFRTLDLQSPFNYKNASDVLRFFNGDYYNLQLNFGTSFNRQAQPISYQLALHPSHRSYAALGGSFIPGSGNGFYTTNVQFSTPFGRDATLQFLGDVDWKNKGRIINKNIYYSRIIGDCYEIQLQYSQAARQVNLTLSLLAFPSHAAGFGINTTGSIIPSSINFR